MQWDIFERKPDFGEPTAAPYYDATDLNSYVLRDMRALAEMAAVLGEPERALHWHQRAEPFARRIAAKMYDAPDNIFYDSNRNTRM